MNIKINAHGNELPEAHGDWVDLALAEDVEMYAGEFRILSLGVSMQIPDGYYAMVAPRSSTYKKWHILQANSIGIIDNDYCGDNDIWGFPAYATQNTKITKGTRICQFTLMKKQEPVCFIPVDSLNNADRGGFGSTGD